MRALEANLDALDLRSRSKVIAFDVFSVAKSIDADIAFADPPYEFEEWPRLLELLTVDVLIAESGRAIEPADGWEQLRTKRYGRATRDAPRARARSVMIRARRSRRCRDEVVFRVEDGAQAVVVAGDALDAQDRAEPDAGDLLTAEEDDRDAAGLVGQ